MSKFFFMQHFTLSLLYKLTATCKKIIAKSLFYQWSKISVPSKAQNLQNLVGQICSHFFQTAKCKYKLVFRFYANYI